MKKRAMKRVSDLINASYGREDWGFVIYEPKWSIIGDPMFGQYEWIKDKEVFRFD
jgi:hypothetical protein